MRTQVLIVGGGPAGLMLSHILQRAGIDSVVLERQSRDHVLQRIRAGLLEAGTVDLLRHHGLGERMDREGMVHDGSDVVWAGRERFAIDVKKHTGQSMMAYGQTAITEDLYAARDVAGGQIVECAQEVALRALKSDRPFATYRKDGVSHRIDFDFVAGCDGSHGICRQAIPADAMRIFEKDYPFGWLAILSRTPPLARLVYANHPRGFALCSRRNPMLSRYYVQCALGDSVEDWSDDRFWQELATRMGPEIAAEISTGPSIEKSITPLRSLVVEPMRWGALFLVGDAAHIVPPTGAKGLNLAFSDVFYLSRSLVEFYRRGGAQALDEYSATALKRVWGATRFSWSLTNLLHRFPDQTEFDQRLQEADLEFLRSNENAQAALCAQYVGLPY